MQAVFVFLEKAYALSHYCDAMHVCVCVCARTWIERMLTVLSVIPWMYVLSCVLSQYKGRCPQSFLWGCTYVGVHMLRTLCETMCVCAYFTTLRYLDMRLKVYASYLIDCTMKFGVLEHMNLTSVCHNDLNCFLVTSLCLFAAEPSNVRGSLGQSLISNTTMFGWTMELLSQAFSNTILTHISTQE